MERVGSTPDHPLHVEVRDRVGWITLDRPDARNAINPAMRQAIPAAVQRLEDADDVSVMVLTGTDPAFCAGLDLKLLGSEPESMLSRVGSGSVRPFPERTKPLIGAVNGAAITGGFELALNCDFLIASERAKFADTHARVGVMPGWGLTPLLADAVGRTRARQISLTGDFVSADQALQWGLVNEVVAHAQLLPRVAEIAASIVDNDPVGVAQMLQTYRMQEDQSLGPLWEAESAGAAAFGKVRKPGDDVAARREAIMNRGRSQL